MGYGNFNQFLTLQFICLYLRSDTNSFVSSMTERAKVLWRPCDQDSQSCYLSCDSQSCDL